MKKWSVVFLLVITIFMVLGKGLYEDLYADFYNFRDVRDAEGMKRLIERLENMEEKDYRMYTLLADAMVEYALWGLPENMDKKIYYEKARKYAEKAIELNKDYAYAYYVRGAAIGRLAKYVGILKSLFMVKDFDYSMKKALELDPKNYFAMIALGMRYRDLPWPFKDFKKAEKYFLKAIEIEPRYLNSYLELGILYEMWNKKEKAVEMFKKVLEMPPMKGFTALGEEAKEIAKEHLEDLGAL